MTSHFFYNIYRATLYVQHCMVCTKNALYKRWHELLCPCILQLPTNFHVTVPSPPTDLARVQVSKTDRTLVSCIYFIIYSPLLA